MANSNPQDRPEPTTVETQSMDFPDGTHYCEIKMPYGTSIYLFESEKLGRLIGGIIITFLWEVRSGTTLNFIDIKAAVAEIHPGAPYDIILDVDKEFIEEEERLTEHALTLFKKHLPKALLEATEQYVEEIIFRALRDHAGKGSYIFNASETELIKTLVKKFGKALKQRLEAPRPGGSEAEWTPDRAEQLLSNYEKGMIVLKDAQILYKQNKHRSNWADFIKMAYPALPGDLVSRLAGRGKGAELNALALDYAAYALGVKPGEYLRKVLTKSRKARNELKDRQ